MKILVFLSFVSIINTSVSQTITNECFVSESHHFSGGRIFNSGEKLFVVSSFRGAGEDAEDGYRHQFLIQHYKSNGGKTKTLFNSGEDYYNSYLSDVIVFKNHFIVVTAAYKTKKIKSKILVIDSKGNLLKEKTIKSFGGLLSNSRIEDQFLFIDRQKKEHLFDLNLKESKIPRGESYCEQFFAKDQFYFNSSGSYTTYSRPVNRFTETEDSVLTKNQIGGCYDGNIIKPDTLSNIILSCKWDPNFSNDVISMYKINGANADELTTFKLGADGHHWVYDALLFNGDIYAVFSCGSDSKASELGFIDIDQFMWLARISIEK
jgi:hypothetical protein